MLNGMQKHRAKHWRYQSAGKEPQKDNDVNERHQVKTLVRKRTWQAKQKSSITGISEARLDDAKVRYSRTRRSHPATFRKGSFVRGVFRECITASCDCPPRSMHTAHNEHDSISYKLDTKINHTDYRDSVDCTEHSGSRQADSHSQDPSMMACVLPAECPVHTRRNVHLLVNIALTSIPARYSPPTPTLATSTICRGEKATT